MSSYAYGGSPGSPCTTNTLTGDHEHHYPTPGLLGYELARPIPAHALTPAALAAVEAHRRMAWRDRLEREVASLVTDHGRPRRLPYDGDPVTARAKSVLKKAQAAGFRTNLVVLSDRCAVEGWREDAAFRATWVRGKTDGATWHEPRDRYEYIDDPRPEPKKAENTKLSLAGRRPVGCPKVHLVLVASRRGFPINVTELEKRISA
jgi:hypothetical protein